VRGLIVVRIGAVITDLRVGQDNYLAGVRGIGENFLVAGDGSVENNFSVAFAFRAVTYAAEDSSILQRKDSLHRNSEEWISKILSPWAATRKGSTVDKDAGNRIFL
jgi:hypothetical protein